MKAWKWKCADPEKLLNSVISKYIDKKLKNIFTKDLVVEDIIEHLKEV